MIHTGKKHRQIKLQRLQKVRFWTFGLLVHQIDSLQEVLKLKQNFRKNEAVENELVQLRSLRYVHFVVIILVIILFSHHSK